MNIQVKKGYILVTWPSFVRIAAWHTGKAKQAKALAFFPFIVVRDMSVVEPWLINHESIHFRQQLEMLIVGSHVLYLFEYLWARLVLRLPAIEGYLYLSGEQEAYLNQHNPQYLEGRRWFAQFHYLFNKTTFTIDNKGGVFILK